tara:strand:- start:329 stop:430 length:102 start_codon:yes stop_codon:yes gene_type:complete
MEDNEKEEFLKSVEKCESIHDRNKHKLDGVINL